MYCIFFLAQDPRLQRRSLKDHDRWCFRWWVFQICLGSTSFKIVKRCHPSNKEAQNCPSTVFESWWSSCWLNWLGLRLWGRCLTTGTSIRGRSLILSEGIWRNALTIRRHQKLRISLPFMGCFEVRSRSQPLDNEQTWEDFLFHSKDHLCKKRRILA